MSTSTDVSAAAAAAVDEFVVEGDLFSLTTKGRVDFFGAKGQIEDGQWMIYPILGIWAFVSPDSVEQKIANVLAADVAAGNGDKVAQVQVGARQAVVLFLEGVLTAELLASAVEHFDDREGELDEEEDRPEDEVVEHIVIDIPNVPIAGRNLLVRVYVKPENDIVTADASGVVV